MTPARPYRTPVSGRNDLISTDLDEWMLRLRLARALDENATRYSFFRTFRFSASACIDEVYDLVVSCPSWVALRTSERRLLLEGSGILVSIDATAKQGYSSLRFNLWAENKERGEATISAIKSFCAPLIIDKTTFCVDWYYSSTNGNLNYVGLEEVAEDCLHDEAYPTLTSGVDHFVRQYLDSPEPILVVQGPPGTGKTRLIRKLLGEMSRRKGESIRAMYTGDSQLLANDRIYGEFISGSRTAFIIEDADHLLTPRIHGNRTLHSFLTIADGVVRSKGRKLIFSTNLPNVGDLDEALTRPGRCYRQVMLRELRLDEAIALARKLCGGESPLVAQVRDLFGIGRKKSLSLAEIYRTVCDVAPDTVVAAKLEFGFANMG